MPVSLSDLSAPTTPVSLDDLGFFDEPIDPFLSIESIPWPKSENRVITVYFNAKIPLNKLVGIVGPVSYRSPKLTAVTIRFHNQGDERAPSAQVFGSGMVVYMGATSEMITLYYVHLTRAIFSQLGLEQEPRNGRLFTQNMVYSGCFYKCLNIKDFEKEEDRIGMVSSNKSFPGIVYMIKPPGCTNMLSFSLFETGRYNVMRLHPDELYTGFFPILRVLQRNSSDSNTRAYAKRRVEAVRSALLNKTEDENMRDVVIAALNSVKETYEIPPNIAESVETIERPATTTEHQYVVKKVANTEFYTPFDLTKETAVPLGINKRKRPRPNFSLINNEDL
jgi:TATA-box binding protein (TBP) (component of TFIID and TFIIIB)